MKYITDLEKVLNNRHNPRSLYRLASRTLSKLKNTYLERMITNDVEYDATVRFSFFP